METLDRIRRRAAASRRHVVLPEGTEPRTLDAGVRAARDGLAQITVLGPPEAVRATAAERGIDLGPVEVAPVPAEGREVDAAVRAYLERNRARGVSEPEAREHLKDPLLWAAVQVAVGRYDGFVAGADAP